MMDIDKEQVSVLDFRREVLFRWGKEGYDLYHELHLNYGNQMIHGLFMPFVVYGIFVGLPAFFVKTDAGATRFRVAIWATYLAYYSSFDVVGATLCGQFYLPALWYLSVYQPYYYHHNSGRIQAIMWGLIFLFGAVGIQEFFGHTFYEERNSNLWELPNSIAIAPLFGIRCLFQIPNF